ncbi:MAG: carbamoyltransferase family protein [Planctomycetota bacterium]|jgi:carbamoyltransferase
MKILGVSAFYHDSAAALVVGGEIVAAAQEERFTRKKHDYRFPKQAAEYCLREGGIATDELDSVVFYDKPVLKFDRLLETYASFAPFGIRSFLMAMPLWLKQKLHIPRIIRDEIGFEGQVLFTEHHASHAASAFYPSPFERAAILTIDGVGEWATTTLGIGEGRNLRLLREIRFPHSLGLLYSAFTYYTGFRVNSGEYKVMGLAPYGEPRFVDRIHDHLIDLREDGSFRLDLRYFNYCAGLTMTSERFHRLFDGPPRKPETPVAQREMDLARSIQVVIEEAMLRMARSAHELTGSENLCLAGGVALNCVGNGKLYREGPFRSIWVQPAAGDAGGALGAALMTWHKYYDKPRVPAAGDSQRGSYLGPSHSDSEIADFLEKRRAPGRGIEREPELIEHVAELLERGKVVGWFQGRMEFGPRALGSRSILGDARSPEMQRTMNLKIKYRESFRPFAPIVLRERVGEWFDHDGDSPYMLLVASVREDRRAPVSKSDAAKRGLELLGVKRSEIPAVTHVDFSARLQTVHDETNPRLARLLRAFEARTGCPVLVNTSFNVRGEPIVCTPEDAYLCFMRTEMDVLVLGNRILLKEEQAPIENEADWRREFVLD